MTQPGPTDAYLNRFNRDSRYVDDEPDTEASDTPPEDVQRFIREQL